MNFRRILTGAASATLMIALSSVASASIIASGTFGFIGLGDTTVTDDPLNPGDLTTAVTIHLPSTQMVNTVPPNAFGDANDFLGLVTASSPVTINPIALSVGGGPFTPISGFLVFGGGRFTFSAESLVISIAANTHTLGLYYLGTFHDTTPDGPNHFEDAPASLTFSFSQPDAGNTINGSATFSTPPSPNSSVPEPATMTLMGCALVGVGAMGRKKSGRR